MSQTRAVVAMVLVCGLVPGLWGQETEHWFEQATAAKGLASIRSQTVALAESWRGDGLPETLLVAKLREGVALRLPPDKLMYLLQEEYEYAVRSARLLRLQGFGSIPIDELHPWIARITLLLRAGHTEAEVASVLSRASEQAPDSPETAQIRGGLVTLLPGPETQRERTRGRSPQASADNNGTAQEAQAGKPVKKAKPPKD